MVVSSVADERIRKDQKKFDSRPAKVAGNRDGGNVCVE